ncbi:MAG: hypothetical protein MH204_10960 [Fimbriimonadaceae bacterium]|nr:hypothetical protein [Fimbriimonadaceae bacterium]
MLCLAILAVLASLALVVSGPVRVRALEGKSLDQMRTIYKGIMLYSADTGSLEELPGLDQIPLGFCLRPHVVLRYGVPLESFYSPLSPMKPGGIGPNGDLRPWGYRLHAFSLGRDYLGKVDHRMGGSPMQRLKEQQDEFALIEDVCFDERIYWPAEQNTDPYHLRKKQLVLQVNGQALKRIRPGVRTGLFPGDNSCQ